MSEGNIINDLVLLSVNWAGPPHFLQDHFSSKSNLK